MSRSHLIQTVLKCLPRRFTHRAETGIVDVLGVFRRRGHEFIMLRFVDYPEGSRRVSYGAISEYKQPGGRMRYHAGVCETCPWCDWLPGLYPSDRHKGMRRVYAKSKAQAQNADTQVAPANGVATAVASVPIPDPNRRGKAVHRENVQRKRGGRRRGRMGNKRNVPPKPG